MKKSSGLNWEEKLLHPFHVNLKVEGKTLPFKESYMKTQ